MRIMKWAGLTLLVFCAGLVGAVALGAYFASREATEND